MTVGIQADGMESRYKYYSRVCPMPGELDVGPVGSQSNRLTLVDVVEIGAEMVGDGLKVLKKRG